MGYVRSRLPAVLLALALTSGVLAFGAAPAQARWSAVGEQTHFRVCKQQPATGRGWVLLARASKRYAGEDARAGMAVYVGRDRRQGWRSGWMGDRVERGWVRAHRRDVVLKVWQEAGDRDSMIGTARSSQRLRADQLRRCG